MSAYVDNPPTSANAALAYKLKVVSDLSIAALVFSIVYPIAGIVGLTVKGDALIFTCGMLFGLHVFWVPLMVS